MDIKSRILAHLTDTYLRSKTNVEDLSNSPVHVGKSMPFTGRALLIAEARKLYDMRIQNRVDTDRNRHPIGIVGGASGIGKSRALNELAKEILNWKEENEWFFPVQITYNNGNPPFIDRKMEAAKAFALRILYFAFVDSKPRLVSFATFVENFQSDLKNIIEPHHAIEVIMLYQRSHSQYDNGVIFLGVDESNYLLDADYEGQANKRSFLKETMIAVTSTLFCHKNVFVFPVVAGTTILPLDAVFADSSVEILPFPIALLDISDCEVIVDEMAKIIPGLENWRTCYEFRTMLLDFGSIPRRAEELLSYVLEQTKKGTPLKNVDFELIYHRFMRKYSCSYIPAEINSKLIADVILERPVHRDDSLGIVNNQKYTYGLLESSGVIALASMQREFLLVQIPLAYFRSLVMQLDGRDVLTVCLRNACDLIPTRNAASVGFVWQTFEQFHGYMEAIREMLLARELGEHSKCSVSELYCIDGLENDFDFKLRRNVPVIESSKRFPSHNTSDSETLGHDAYVRNAPGAAFDSFTFRQLDEEDQQILFCGQQKLFSSKVLTMADINAELKKVDEALGGNTEYFLVIFASKVHSEVSQDSLPDRCCLVTGRAWTKFYSSLFAARARIIFDSDTMININTATKSELMNVARIGGVLADRIITNRNIRQFDNWDDVRQRIAKIPLNAERNFIY